MVIYGVYNKDADFPECRAHFTSEDDAKKYAVLLGESYEICPLLVDSEDSIRRARNGLKPWFCVARSDDAGPDWILHVAPRFHADDEPAMHGQSKHVQLQRHTLMRPWDDSYNDQRYTMPSCGQLSFTILAASYETARGKAEFIRKQWLAGESLDTLSDFVESV